MTAYPLEKTLRTPADLRAAGLLDRQQAGAIADVAQRYVIAITPALARLIDAGDANDPIARQFVPTANELTVLPQELADPISDHAYSPLEGIVHRYPDRVLLKVVHACPVYCRFCFRREMVGPGGRNLTGSDLDAAIAYIAEHPEIWEVVMTGGDPLVLTPRRAAEITRRLAAIAHVKVIRWHTRVPVVDPERVTTALVKALRAPGKAVYVAIHANHPREFSPAACTAVARLADAGLALVSQTVLLRGINNDAETLAALMRCFVENRIKPYYLHHPDLAPGTSHFRLPIEEGQELVRALRGRLSGLCQPEYVLDIPGGHGKSPIGPSYLSGDGSAQAVTDYRGNAHLLTK